MRCAAASMSPSAMCCSSIKSSTTYGDADSPGRGNRAGARNGSEVARPRRCRDHVQPPTRRWPSREGARTCARRRLPAKAACQSRNQGECTSVTEGRPVVSVPVLSNTTTSTRWASSNDSALLINTPWLGSLADSDHHRRRSCQTHRARAGDDEDRDRRQHR